MCEKGDVNEKKRGRPKKPITKKTVPHSNIKSIMNNLVTPTTTHPSSEELFLHIPYTSIEMSECSKIDLSKNILRQSCENVVESVESNEMLVISDLMSTVSDEENIVIENKSLDVELLLKIKELEDKILFYEEKLGINKDDDVEQRISMLNIRFININNGIQEVIEKTDVACWWCSYSFENVPCFLPEKMVNNVFYVFGNFCSYNCAAAYNLDINDYRVWERYGLLKKLYNLIYDKSDEIIVSPRKECLSKFGGPLSIEEFRNSLLVNTKEYRLVMPPMKSIIPFIEENNDVTLIKKRFNTNDDLVLKRSKPLPNARNNILETLNVGLKNK